MANTFNSVASKNQKVYVGGIHIKTFSKKDRLDMTLSQITNDVEA